MVVIKIWFVLYHFPKCELGYLDDLFFLASQDMSKTVPDILILYMIARGKHDTNFVCSTCIANDKDDWPLN